MPDRLWACHLLVLTPAEPVEKVRARLIELHRNLDTMDGRIEAHVDLRGPPVLRGLAPSPLMEQVVAGVDRIFPVGTAELEVFAPGTHPLHASHASPFMIGAHLWCRLGADALLRARTRPNGWSRDDLEPWCRSELEAYRSYPEPRVFWDLANRGVEGLEVTPLELFQAFLRDPAETP